MTNPGQSNSPNEDDNGGGKPPARKRKPVDSDSDDSYKEKGK